MSIHWPEGEYWKLSPEEFVICVEGYAKKENAMMEKLAWHAANVMNPHLARGKGVTGAKLLGRQRSLMGMNKTEIKETLGSKEGSA